MQLNLFKKLLFAGVFLACGFTYAQQEKVLNGKIVDFATFMPIESASVYVQDSYIGTVSNSDGKFSLVVPPKHVNDTLVISSIGFKSFKTAIADFDPAEDIFLEEDIASLDEVVVVADPRPTTGNDIVIRALERLPRNLPDSSYIQKGFLRHKERNQIEYKWLIESAISLYDSTYVAGGSEYLKVNVDENRKSYDLRDVDSLFTYYSYLRDEKGMRIKADNLRRDTIKTASLVEAIKWNDNRVNGLGNLFNGKLNMVRNAGDRFAILGDKMLERHQFTLDTVLVDDGRKVYKIRIEKGSDYVGLNTPGIYNEGFEPKGWIYIDWKTYAIKRIEYELIAASDAQRRRSKSLFGTTLNHKLVITYKEFEDKWYPNYIYYETPKLVNIGNRSSDQQEKTAEQIKKEREEQFYYTVQEIVFTEIIRDDMVIAQALSEEWSDDIFIPRPYNQAFWKTYNVLLESEEEEKLIRDLSTRASLFKE
ncbi:carboxypeptidase-like regulatory domain-containing protein [Gilvibacter sediminis]|uniref:carboxypeptidase-like regulatory domain-containing protein n=1 Tax=Gilvibacter sediminis TaxID=379071 RepID=UPI00234FDECC|nr:carboxypeptidase-like regulatory domain-containing protein [Gilvibacter sediminis]MDC7998447.1 carboxypeptidase-like regulatory domain-containing protein [Gilvibacter sediminis]